MGWRLLWSCLLPDSLGGSRVCPWARLTRAAASGQLLAGDRQRPQLARSSQSHTCSGHSPVGRLPRFWFERFPSGARHFSLSPAAHRGPWQSDNWHQSEQLEQLHTKATHDILVLAATPSRKERHLSKTVSQKALVASPSRKEEQLHRKLYDDVLKG